MSTREPVPAENQKERCMDGFSRLMAKSSHGILLIDSRGEVRFANPAAESLIGTPLQGGGEIPHQVRSLMGDPGEYTLARSDSDVITSLRVEELQCEGETVKVAFLHDTTERKRTENELEAKLRRLEVEKALYEGIVDAIGDGITIQDTEYRIFYQNRPHRELMGDHVGAYCYQAYGGRESVCDDCPLRVVLEEEISHTVERHVGKGDDTQFFEITVSPLRDSTGKVVAGIEVIREITERKRAEERLRYMSSHDVLTGLYNRSFFEEELERLQRGRHFPLSVIMADVDDLKVVNDSKGHSAGDELLVRAAILFKEAFRGEDIVARIGGDEFAVLLPSTDAETADVALMRVREALDSWNRNYPIPINLSLGRGTAMEGDEILSALKAADQSMYQYKLERTGRAPRREPNGTGSR